MGSIGVKGVTILSLALTAASLLLAVFVTDIWMLTLTFGLVSGIATGLVASVLGPTVANRWFVNRRGLVVGVFGASTSAGQLVFFPLLTTLAVAVGWRAGAIVLVAIMLVLIVPVLLFFRNDPADVGLLPQGADPATPIQPSPPPEPGVMRRAVRPSTSGSSPRRSSSAARHRTGSSASTSSPTRSTTASPRRPPPGRLRSWARSTSSGRSGQAG